MEEIKRYQLRGLEGDVVRLRFGERIVDYWAPSGGSGSLLIAHDGQNIFDWRSATNFATWRLAQSANKLAKDLNQSPPVVVAIFHGKSKSDPYGRARDLCPEDAFREGVQPLQKPTIAVDQLRGNQYLFDIFENIIPSILKREQLSISPNRTAMIGSSMGALATLYSLIEHGAKFHTALALSPHWTLGGAPLVDWMIPRLSNSREHRIFLSRGERGYDSEYHPFQSQAEKLLEKSGWNSRYQSRIFNGAKHNERAWARQVSDALSYWLSKS
jgi:predicted alpha/beta superfamily hydrolase